MNSAKTTFLHVQRHFPPLKLQEGLCNNESGKSCQEKTLTNSELFWTRYSSIFNDTPRPLEVQGGICDDGSRKPCQEDRHQLRTLLKRHFPMVNEASHPSTATKKHLRQRSLSRRPSPKKIPAEPAFAVLSPCSQTFHTVLELQDRLYDDRSLSRFKKTITC